MRAADPQGTECQPLKLCMCKCNILSTTLHVFHFYSKSTYADIIPNANICLADIARSKIDDYNSLIQKQDGSRNCRSHCFVMEARNLSVAGIQSYEKGSYADRIREQVIKARQNSEWRRQYMDWKMTLLSERSKGREEGLVEGREAGLAEGRQAGILLSEIDLITKK